LNTVKREQFPWMYDVTNAAVQEAIIDPGTAFRAFFEQRGRYPRFKRKEDRAAFGAANTAGTFRADGKRLPVVGWVRMREAVRFSGPLKRATVLLDGGRCYVGLMIETDGVCPVLQPVAAVGVELGVAAHAALSTGEVIEGAKSCAAALERLRRRNRAQARKRRGSANFRKAKARLAKLHARIASIRRDATHKLMTGLTKTYRTIGIEDLNVRGIAAHAIWRVR
jgi:putative transposase